MASTFKSFPSLRATASRVSQDFFTCRSCLRAQLPSNAPIRVAFQQRPISQVATKTLPRVLRYAPFKRSSSTVASSADIGHASVQTAQKIGSKAFPEVSDRSVAYWLLGSAASVFGIVVFGGLTRLTESGLSITEWRPVTGSLPPMNAEDWDTVFTKYRSSPEFHILNSKMTLEEFKQIYWMEWGHRLWGRVIGITFLLPTIYFVARRKVSGPMALRLTGICGLIGFQGFLGWWMVKSGLKDDLFTPGSHPRVSQYRLTAHLGAAFLVYTSMLLSGLAILRERKLLANPKAAQKLFQTLRHPGLRTFRIAVTALSALVFATAMSGALVAGLDAGLIYNDFPWMGVGLTPPKNELWDPWYSHTADNSDLWWRNMLENPSLVQLDHRIMATTTFTTILSLFAYSRFGSRVKTQLPSDARKAVLGTVHLVTLQVALGISTLWYLVPTWLASMHQAGSLALLTGVLVLRHRVSTPARSWKLIQQALKHRSNVSASPVHSLGKTALSSSV